MNRYQLEATHPQEIIDREPMSFAQKRAVGLVALISMVDGYDVLAVTYAAPGIAREWALQPAALGGLLSSGLAGMALGSLLLAPLADMIGRRKMVMANLMLMGAGLLLSALATSLGELVLWRALTGIGIGAMVPIITPLAVEFTNRQTRGLSLALMTIGYPLGGTAGGFLAGLLLSHFAWPSVFLLGAGLTLGLLLMTFLWLPEPLTFLLERRDERTLDRVNALLTRFNLPAVAGLPPVCRPPVSHPYRAIFAPDQWRATLIMMLVNLLFVMSVYYMLSWIPKLVVDAGYSLTTATFVSVVVSLSGAVAGLAIGLVIRNAVNYPLVAFLMIGLGITIPLFTSATASSSLGLIFIAGGLAGVFLYGAAVGAYGVLVATFAPQCRATGAGFVLGVGRASAALAPALAGILFAAGMDSRDVAIALGTPTIIAGLLLLLMRHGNAE